jgi:hypothetical protein
LLPATLRNRPQSAGKSLKVQNRHGYRCGPEGSVFLAQKELMETAGPVFRASGLNRIDLAGSTLRSEAGCRHEHGEAQGSDPGQTHSEFPGVMASSVCGWLIRIGCYPVGL